MACNNSTAVRNCEDGAAREKTKHLDIKYCFIRDVCRRGLVNVEWIGTKAMVDGALTKPLRGHIFYGHTRSLGMIKGSG
jgi:hypothetical protein